jgi:enediyne biosynthesis protein E4
MNSFLSKYISLVLLLILTGSCQNNTQTLFEKLPSNQTNLDFKNELFPNDLLNAFNFTNYYNGGGVGVGDFNKDGLPDLFFSGNQVSCELYLNKTNQDKSFIQFEKITETAGVKTNSWCSGVSIVDINQDGWDDIYVSVASHSSFKSTRNLLFINQKTESPTFKEEAALYHLDYAGFTTQSVFFDYDLDGDLDVYLLNTAPDIQNPVILRPTINDGSYPSSDKLFRNDGLSQNSVHPTFTDVSVQSGITFEGLGLGVVVSDINQDGYPDIYCANDFMSSDILYLNQQDGTFKNTINTSMPHTSLFGMGVDAADINNDAKVDLLELDMMPEDNNRQKQMLSRPDYDKKELSISPQYGYELQYMRNTLQINQGNEAGTPIFSDLGLLAGVAKTDWSWASLLTDLDNDGRKDIFITTGYRKNITDLDFINFNASNNQFGNEKSQSKSREELLAQVPEVKLRNYAYRNTQTLTFENVSKTWGLDELSYANGAVYVDLDQDGDLDLVVNNIDSEASIFKNNTNQKNENNYLKVNLKGQQGNRDGFGAKVSVWTNDTVQYFENYPIRGYLSSVEKNISVGLGNHKIIDSLRVEWNNGKTETKYKVATNQVIHFDIDHAKSFNNKLIQPNPIFETQTNLIDYQHQVSDFNDFKQVSALHKMYSQNGCAVAVGDINGDNLNDVFVGGSYRGSGNKVFIQQKNGTFKSQNTIETSEMTIGDAQLFDADQDGDKDLIIVGGGNERPINVTNAYQPILYLNQGNGQFLKTSYLPSLAVSSQAIRILDYDKDNDWDIVICGRQIPNQYPMPASCYILRNEKGSFVNVTEKIAPFLKNIGLVCDALPVDFDQDNDTDLILVGEWMPITFMENKGGKFSKITLENSEGWWNCIAGGDFDQDGDVDFLVGNEGLNTFYKASKNEPISLFAKDFNQDGQIDPIMGYYVDGQNSPALPRESLNQQIVQFRKKYVSYADYAKVNYEDLLTQEDKEGASFYQVSNLKSSYIENKGNGKYAIKALPILAQQSPIFNFLVKDFDKDGKLDAVVSGNFYPNEAHLGRQDASRGIFLKGDGNGNFKVLSNAETGLKIVGDARRSYFLGQSNQFISSVNNGKILFHRWK